MMSPAVRHNIVNFLPRFESDILFLEKNVSVNNWSADSGKEEG